MFVKELLCVKSGSRLRWNLGNLCQSILDGGLIKNKTSLVLVICLKSTAVNMVIYRPCNHSITTLATLLLQVISDDLLPSQSLPQKWSFAHLGRKQAWLCSYTTCGTFWKLMKIYIYKTVMFDRVFALGRVRIPAPASDMSCPTGPRNRWWFFVDQIVDPGDHQNHAAPQRKPNPDSTKSHLTKTLLWTCKLFRKSVFFADFLFVGRSVGSSC